MEKTKFAVVKCVNNNFAIASEHENVDPEAALTSARIAYLNLCAALWNEPTVERAVVVLVNRDLTQYGDYKEYIGHETKPEAEEE